jgi:hypothetical protein
MCRLAFVGVVEEVVGVVAVVGSLAARRKKLLGERAALRGRSVFLWLGGNSTGGP